MSFTSTMAASPRWRDVYLASVARGVSTCGDFLAATALALTLQTRGDNGYGVAALLVASTLPMAVFSPLAGRLADRVDSRLILTVTSLAQAVVCVLLSFADRPIDMIALMAVLAAGLAVTQPTLSALIPDMVGTEQLPRAMSILQITSAAGMLAGPALGGLLIGQYDLRLVLLLDAGSYLALAVAGLTIQTRRGGRAEVPATVTGAGAAPPAGDRSAAASPASAAAQVGSWRLRHDRLLVILIGSLTAVITAVTAVNVAEIFFVRETLGASEAMYGLVTAVWTLGVLIGAWPFGKLRGDDRRLVLGQVVVLMLACGIVLASAGVPNATWLLPLYVVGGGLNAGINVISGVVVGRRVPAPIRGQVFGLVGGIVSAGNMIGYMIGGLILPLTTPRMVLAGTGVVGILVGAAFLVPLMTMGSRSRRTATPVSAGSVAAATVGYRAEV